MFALIVHKLIITEHKKNSRPISTGRLKICLEVFYYDHSIQHIYYKSI